MSVDGVTETKSTSTSIDVYSSRFKKCRTIYPFQIVRPLGKFRVDNQEYLDNFLTNLCSHDCEILAFIGDNYKRSDARHAKCHSSYYPCEYCEAKGHLLSANDNSLKARREELFKQKKNIENQIAAIQESDDVDHEQIEAFKEIIKSITEAIKNIGKKNSYIVWPASTRNATPRTVEGVTAIVEKIENDDILNIDEAKGITGKSLFLEIPYFNYILGIPVEYLHSVCIGPIKRLIELTFAVGENRKRNTTRKLSLPATFNALMIKVKVPRESSRRARELDFHVMKGQEFRNIVLLFFPLVIKCIEPQAKERRLWLLLVYMVRLCVLPEDEFKQSNPDVIDYCGKHYYELYERLFSSKNCTYYTHVISCHMKEIRSLGPLTESSAFGFESFYGELRHAFVPGTSSPLVQMLKNIIIKRAIGPHCCESSIFLSPKETAHESNCYIYTFQNNQYSFFKIISIENETLTCHKVGKYFTSFPETPTLKWEKIGVFKAGGISNEIENINKKSVAGKFVRVDDLFITCSNNVLREK